MRKTVYSILALEQIPRLLSTMDRNKGSATYGCLYRPFWHDKATDIACSHPQLGVLALALVYANKMPDNIYYLNEKVLDWIIGSMKFWCSIQNNDGSFNEHYPNEHSYGATAWTLSSIVESFRILKYKMEEEDKDKILRHMEKASKWLMKNPDPGPLTNHQAITAFCLLRMANLTGNDVYMKGCRSTLQEVLKNQNSEGWFVEYDGPDLGYLTTSISFLAKCYRELKTPELLKSIKSAIDFSSYFVYPDGSYGGIGCRHTTHFHPHGYEIVASEFPTAANMLKIMSKGFETGAALRPSVMDEKYFSNLIIELLYSHIDKSTAQTHLDLPFSNGSFVKFFENAGIFTVKTSKYYAALNGRKGGELVIFDHKAPLYKNSGIVAKTNSKKLITTQWTDKNYKINYRNKTIEIKGSFHPVPKNYITTSKFILTRALLCTLGISNKLSFRFKKFFIKKLITNSKPSRTKFERIIDFDDGKVTIKDSIFNAADLKYISHDSVFYGRYVPASRYFSQNDLLPIKKENIQKEKSKIAIECIVEA